MIHSVNDSVRRTLSPLVAPLALASYVAWFAVWISVTGRLGVPGEDFGWIGEALLLVFLMAWLTCLALETHKRRWITDVSTLVLAVSALGLISLGRSGSTPILLVLVASMLVGRLKWPWGVAAGLLLINLVFAALLIFRWGMPFAWLIPSVAAYGAFQVFAVLVLRYANEARDSAEQLQQVNANLLATRALLSEAARDQERLRLSRELHDVAGHKLTALKLNLRHLNRSKALDDSPELKVAEQLAGELLDDLRSVARQLRKHDGIDLGEGIRQLARPMPRPHLEIDIEPGLRVPRAEQAEALLRTVQEGLTNSARHSQADQAWLKLYQARSDLVLELADNGHLSGPARPGNGLTGMRERLESLGGSLDLEQAEQGGLKLTVRLPVEQR